MGLGLPAQSSAPASSVGTAEEVLGTTVLGEAAEDWTLTERPMYAPGAARAFAEW